MRSTLGIVLRRSRPIRRPLILCVAASPNSGRLDAASLELRLRWPCAKLFMSCFEPAEEACIAAISGRRRWRLCGEDPHPGGQLRRGQHACVSTHERPWLRQGPGARQLVPACLPGGKVGETLVHDWKNLSVDSLVEIWKMAHGFANGIFDRNSD